MIAEHLSPVLGIGTVEIPTKRSPNLSGASSHGSLHLKEVLHVPDAPCNIVAMPIVDSEGYSFIMSSGPKSNGSIKDGQGKNVAYFDPSRPLFVLKVRNPPSGPRLGPHVLHHGALYLLGCRWSPTEQQKWEDFKIVKAPAAPAAPASASTSDTERVPPYTEEEKTYIKDKSRSEYHFLRSLGLSIYKEDDRAECRTILRTLMATGAFEEESEDDEFDLEGHQADYNFSHNQLD